MDSLSDENRIAREKGLTYGKYKAMLFLQDRKDHAPQSIKYTETLKEKSHRRYTDEEAFALWREGKSDSEIGNALGVSRQSIQKWRDTMEIPSVAKYEVETEKYSLVKTSAGMYVIYEDDH